MVNVPCQSSDGRHEEAPDQRAPAADDEAARRRAPTGGSTYQRVRASAARGTRRSRLTRVVRRCPRTCVDRIQPTWLHQKPVERRRVHVARLVASTCGGRGGAPAHQSTPFCALVVGPRRPSTNWSTRLSGSCGARSSGGSPPSRRTCARSRAPTASATPFHDQPSHDADDGGDVHREERDRSSSSPANGRFRRCFPRRRP